MGRQLWHIAVADLVFHTFAIAELVMKLLATTNMLVAGANTSTWTNSCILVDGAYSIGLCTSSILETHLAMSFTATIFRWPRVLNFLRRTLLLVWLLGCLVSLVETYSEHYSWADGAGCRDDGSDITFTLLYAMCTFLSLISYVACLAKVCIASHTVGHAVAQRVWDRVSFYILASLVCNLLWAIRISSEHNIVHTTRALNFLAMVLVCTNGLANTLVYALQSRYVRGVTLHHAGIISLTTNRDPDCDSFHVGLGNVDVSIIQSYSKDSQTHTDTACGSTAQSQADTRAQDVHSARQRQITSECSDQSLEDILLGCFDEQ
jgi:hypothetical protein